MLPRLCLYSGKRIHHVPGHWLEVVVCVMFLLFFLFEIDNYRVHFIFSTQCKCKKQTEALATTCSPGSQLCLHILLYIYCTSVYVGGASLNYFTYSSSAVFPFAIQLHTVASACCNVVFFFLKTRIIILSHFTII